jgi:aspartate/methionine/tyrosine aminotransferase
MPTDTTARPYSRRSEIDSFKVMDVMVAAARLEAAGRHIVHMEVGQPGTPAPRVAREAVARIISRDRLGYTLALGIPELRERISRHYRDAHGLEVPADRIIITTGSSAAFSLAFHALFDVGDRLLLPTPGYPCYLNIALTLGLAPVFVASGPDTRWTIDPARIGAIARAQGARGLLIASPNNPTGTMLTPERVAAVVAASGEAGLHLISDEIYHGLSYGMRADTVLAHTDRAIVINSFSKYFSMTGWRVGWMVVPTDLVRTIERLAQNFFICPPAIAQHAALAAFSAREELDGYRAVYARNRERLLSALPGLGFDCSIPADGAFYIYANVSQLSDDAQSLAQSILVDAGVAATAGHDFHVRGSFPVIEAPGEPPDRERAARYMRFSYAGSEADIALAIERLTAWRAQRG